MRLASCRYIAFAAGPQLCDLCSSCANVSEPQSGSAAWPRASSSIADASDRDGTLFDSYTRVEPPLPRLLPFSLSLNGQQFEVSDADRTAEVDYLMYTASVYNLSIGGGPIAGGTLVTLTGRGFARAGARPSSSPNRFGTLWHHRNATLAARCRFVPWGQPALEMTTAPVELRDDQIVCPTPPVAPAGLGSSTVVGVMLSLNAAHFNGTAPAAAGSTRGPFDVAHYEGRHATPEVEQPTRLNLTLYPQVISQIVPPGGPIVGGTIVRVEGFGLQSFAPHPAACRFDQTPSDADLSGTSEEASAINCTAPGHDPIDNASFTLALNYQRRPCEPMHELVAPAFGLASGLFDADECVDEFRDHYGSKQGYRGSFRPRGGLTYDYYVPPVRSAASALVTRARAMWHLDVTLARARLSMLHR